jgi:hypothetical protein
MRRFTLVQFGEIKRELRGSLSRSGRVTKRASGRFWSCSGGCSALVESVGVGRRLGFDSKEIAPLAPEGAAAQPRIPKNRRSDPRGVGSNVCTRVNCLFISRSVCQRWLTPGRHGLTFGKSRASEDAVPFGFCSGGFSSTSSLRSGQRGSTEVERRSLLTKLIVSSRAPSRFYPRGSDESADSSCANLSASAGASVAATFTADCCPQASRRRVARRSPCRS